MGLLARSSDARAYEFAFLRSSQERWYWSALHCIIHIIWLKKKKTYLASSHQNWIFYMLSNKLPLFEVVPSLLHRVQGDN